MDWPKEGRASAPELHLDLAKEVELSAVVAGYREGEELALTCASLLERADEVKRLQIIAVDDCSDDGQANRLPPGVELMRSPNRLGCGNAHNWGATRADGSVVIFPDSHMRFPPGSMAQLAAACAEYKGLACAGVQHITKTHGCQGWGAKFRFHRNGRLGVQYAQPPNRVWPAADIALPVQMPFGGCYAFWREAFDKIGGWLDVAAIWGYCEQPLGYAAWALDLPILAVPAINKHLYRKHNPSGAGIREVWLNVAYSHYVLFQEETFKTYWRPILINHLGETALDEVLVKAEIQERRSNFQRVIKKGKTDARFFREVLGVRVTEGQNGAVKAVPNASLIVLAHNEGKEPTHTIRSLMGAALRDPEVILIDDASSDNCAKREVISTRPGKEGKKVKQFAENVRILRNKQRLGVCRSRLVGIAQAKEDVLCFFDGHSRACASDVDRMIDAAYDTKGLIVGTITGLIAGKPRGEDRPLYGGRFCIKPKWGLRLAYFRQKPATELNRINGPIGSAYAIRKDVLKALRSWPPLPGAWAYSEQGLGLKCYALGVPIYNHAGTLFQHLMKHGEIDVPETDVLLNAHYVHRAYFDEETYLSIWRPLLLERGYDPLIDEMLKSRLLLDEAEWFQANRRTTDEEFFRLQLGRHPEDLLAINLKGGKAVPHTQAGYIAYEARRSPGREWLADRPRMERHLSDLIMVLNGKSHADLRCLDIGSRDGWILDRMQELGFRKENLQGLELCPWSAAHARTMGRDIVTGDAHDLSRWQDQSRDIVTLIHSIEHCHTPEKALAEVRRVLKDDGVCMIVTPIEPEGVSLKGDHCTSMRSPEMVAGLLTAAGFSEIGRAMRGSELTVFGRKTNGQ